MKKYLILILVLSFTLTGCFLNKKNEVSTNTIEEPIKKPETTKNSLENVTEDNYAQVMKEVFGIEPIYGEDWTIKEVRSPNKVNNFRVNYKTPYDINTDEWREKYFNATLAVSTDGINGIKMNMDTGALSKGEKVDSYAAYKAGDFNGWYYYFNGKQIQANISIYAGDALIMFTITNI